MIPRRRIKAMAKKEIRHIVRDPFTLIFALFMPMLLVVIFGAAIDFQAKNIEIAVDDRDQSRSSRSLIDVFENSHQFIVENSFSILDPEQVLRSEQKKAVIVIPRGFEKKLLSGNVSTVQIVVDGADNAMTGSIMSYITGIMDRYNKNIAQSKNLREELRVVPKFMYNNELKSTYFTVPGLTAVVLAIISILLTALTVSRDYENGPMEQLLSTPTSPLEIIIGKVLPYIAICIISSVIVYVAARTFFGVPFLGSHVVLTIGTLLFLLAYLAQGILISVVAKKQVLAMQMALLSGLLPTMLLSGFIFPIESMPTIFQVVTVIFPARWFIEMSRALFLKGSDLSIYLKDILILILIDLLLITAAVKKLKREIG